MTIISWTIVTDEEGGSHVFLVAGEERLDRELVETLGGSGDYAYLDDLEDSGTFLSHDIEEEGE